MYERETAEPSQAGTAHAIIALSLTHTHTQSLSSAQLAQRNTHTYILIQHTAQDRLASISAAAICEPNVRRAVRERMYEHRYSSHTLTRTEDPHTDIHQHTHTHTQHTAHSTQQQQPLSSHTSLTTTHHTYILHSLIHQHTYTHTVTPQPRQSTTAALHTLSSHSAAAPAMSSKASKGDKKRKCQSHSRTRPSSAPPPYIPPAAVPALTMARVSPHWQCELLRSLCHSTHSSPPSTSLSSIRIPRTHLRLAFAFHPPPPHPSPPIPHKPYIGSHDTCTDRPPPLSLLCVCLFLAASSSSSSKKSKKESKRKEKRAKKDPDAPKRAVSAYLLFSQDHRPQLKKEQPDLAFGAVAKELARRWADADAQTREVNQPLPPATPSQCGPLTQTSSCDAHSPPPSSLLFSVLCVCCLVL